MTHTSCSNRCTARGACGNRSPKPLFLLLALLLGMAHSSLGSADEIAETIDAFRGAGETAPFFDSAYGYVVFPTIGKGGIGIGGARGKGRVYRQGLYIGDATMTQLTVGFQLGGQAFSQMIFLEDARALESFISGNFEFSAQATAVAITAGVSAEANTGGGTTASASGGRNDAAVTHGGYRKGMAVFTIARGGLMYEASLGGQKFSFKSAE
jgi:lipid-binding SYLF domain-containing protein